MTQMQELLKDFYEYLRVERGLEEDEALSMIETVAAFRDYCLLEDVETIVV